MKKLTLILCLISLLVNSQENLQELATDYINSQTVFSSEIFQEKFFMHTNKSLYFSSENIWYKIYVVYDATNTPSYKTSNLHINVYNNKKELIESKLIFVENGTANGFIKLDPSYASGAYYITLNTVYSSNFNSKYLKQIDVVNLKKDQPDFNESKNVTEKTIPEDAVSNLDIEFVPESNLLLSRAYNTMYIKATFNGNPLKLDGSIINDNFDAEVKKVTTNKDGIGSVTLPYYPNKKYILKTTINGKEYIKPLPLPKSKGFVIHYDNKNSTSKEVLFKVSTNNETNKDYADGEIIYAVIHRKGFLKSVTPIILESKFNIYALEIEKEGLLDGINTLTIFNYKNEEIANRNFFFNKNKEVLLSVEKGKETKDSIQLKINMLNRFVKANSSISVLTEATKMYANSSNIRADYLLNPYLELNALNQNKVLNKTNSLKEVDMLLQIKTNVKMEPLLKDSNKVQIEPENGLSISGRVNSSLKNLKGFKVLLTSKENGIVLFEKLEGENTFTFNNLLLFHPSQYKLALLNPSGVVQEAGFTINPIATKYKVDSIIKFKTKETESVYYKLKEKYNNSVFVDILVEQLDEVSVLGKKTKKKDVTSLDSIGYINNPKQLGNGFTKTIKKDPIQCSGCTLIDYLNQLPNIKAASFVGSAAVVFTSRGINTFLGSTQAYVLLDGIPLNSDLSTLVDLYADDVEFVQVNRSGAGYGFNGASGVINIKLKKIGERSKKTFKVLTTTSQTDFGFNLNTMPFRYMPLQFSSSRAKTYYDAIDWIPDFTIMPNKTNLINIAKEGNENLKIIINGFNAEGDLLYKEVNINSNNIN